MVTSYRASRFVLAGAHIAVLMLLLGALGSRFGLWSFFVGFYFLFAGIVVALICAVWGIAALVFSRGAGPIKSRVPFVYGAILSSLVLTTMFVQFLDASRLPPIHDISTDLIDPPEFDHLIEVRGRHSNDLTSSDEERQQQAIAYPAIKTLRTGRDLNESFDRVLAVATAMDWEIVHSDRRAGIVESTATTFWFGFKDDVVIRIRDAGGASLIDLRSVSRVGMSDLGTNAARIARFLQNFDAKNE